MLQGCTYSRETHVIAEGVAENWPNQVSWGGETEQLSSSPTTSLGNYPHPLDQCPTCLPTYHGLCLLPPLKPHQAEGPALACLKDYDKKKSCS